MVLQVVRLRLERRMETVQKTPAVTHGVLKALFGVLSAILLSGALTTRVIADEILVAAAASLTDALKEIGSLYETRTNNHVNFNFGASSTLARQIEEGAPADMFFSADDAQMNRLEQGGHIEPGSRKDLLSNQLVIVVPRDSKLSIASPKDL